MNANTIIELLELHRAPSDTVRAQVLRALVNYGKATGDSALVEAAQAAKPAADPFVPPKEWKDQYTDAFRVTADPDCSVDPNEDERYCLEYWQMLTDAERARRQGNPGIGFADGQKDAENLNSATL